MLARFLCVKQSLPVLLKTFPVSRLMDLEFFAKHLLVFCCHIIHRGWRGVRTSSATLHASLQADCSSQAYVVSRDPLWFCQHVVELVRGIAKHKISGCLVVHPWRIMDPWPIVHVSCFAAVRWMFLFTKSSKQWDYLNHAPGLQNREPK